MKQISYFLLFFLILISFNKVNGQQRKLSFCDGIKFVQKAFQDGKEEELKDNISPDNKFIYTTKIDIDEVTNEFVATNVGTFYRVTYKPTTSQQEQEKFMKELVNKLENCFNKKAKKSDINGYKIKVGKVTLSAMYFGSMAIILNISDEE